MIRRIFRRRREPEILGYLYRGSTTGPIRDHEGYTYCRSGTLVSFSTAGALPVCYECGESLWQHRNVEIRTVAELPAGMEPW